MTATFPQATADQVREYFGRCGYDVRISRNGHVTFRPCFGKHPWQDGRWLEEYKIANGSVTKF